MGRRGGAEPRRPPDRRRYHRRRRVGILGGLLGGGGDSLLSRLSDNARVISGAVALLTEAVAAGRRITPAGEWLLDNDYLIDEQIRTARRDLPRRYSRELPRLAAGPSSGLPRVYDIALEAISHGDGRVDAASLGGFVAAYQCETVLRLGELWAIPIMLRLALIENLRRVAAWVVVDRMDRNLADEWADRIRSPRSERVATKSYPIER